MRIQRSRLLGIAGMAILLSLMVSCGKESYTTKPQLKFIKAKNYTVSRGDLIEMTVEFTDKEGDLTDSLFIQTVTTKCPQSNRKLGYPMPVFPTSNNIKGEVQVTFVNGTFIPGYVALPGPACGKPDTTTFKFWIRDKAKNVSDTITTDKPIIILN
jgi:hypothetical protein